MSKSIHYAMAVLTVLMNCKVQASDDGANRDSSKNATVRMRVAINSDPTALTVVNLHQPLAKTQELSSTHMTVNEYVERKQREDLKARLKMVCAPLLVCIGLSFWIWLRHQEKSMGKG